VELELAGIVYVGSRGAILITIFSYRLFLMGLSFDITKKGGGSKSNYQVKIFFWAEV